MATTKLTITLDDEQVQAVRRLVETGQAATVSGFVHAVGVALLDATGWRQMLDGALRDTRGPLTTREREWADALLTGRRPRRPPARRGSAV